MRIRLLQFGFLPFPVLFMTMDPAFSQDGSSWTEYLGACLVLLCVAGRAWSILYIGGKKNRELVTAGPYSITRNPLYFFSMIGVFGIGLFIGSVALAVGLAAVVYLVLAITAQKEAAHLESLFGQQFRDYAHQTPNFWPKPSLYRDVDEVTFSPKALRSTLRDGLLFIAALLVIEILEEIRHSDLVPVFFSVI